MSNQTDMDRQTKFSAEVASRLKTFHKMFIILFFLSIKHAALVANLMYQVEYNFFNNNQHPPIHLTGPPIHLTGHPPIHLTGHPPIHLTGSHVTIEHWTSSATVGFKSSGLMEFSFIIVWLPIEKWPPPFFIAGLP